MWGRVGWRENQSMPCTMVLGEREDKSGDIFSPLLVADLGSGEVIVDLCLLDWRRLGAMVGGLGMMVRHFHMEKYI